MKKQIPNIITLCNLFCGLLSIYFSFYEEVLYAALFICLGIFFDFFDGLAARALGVSSPLGKELDSLADVITSGVAPGFILFMFLMNECEIPFSMLPFLALLIPVFSAYRLAKFNLDTRQTHSFLGLPTPANALVWVGFSLWIYHPELSLLPINIEAINNHSMLLPEWVGMLLLAVSFILDVMLISEIPLFALKIKNLSWKDNRLRYVFIISAVALIVLMGGLGISITILWYIILSIITRQKAEQE